MTEPVKIQADLDHPDRVLAGLTARQVLILAGTALVIYSGWLLTQTVVPVLVFLLCAVPVAVTGIALALFRRDGLGLDRLAAAALWFRLRPRRLTGPPPPGGAPVPVWLSERAVEQPHDISAGTGGGGQRVWDPTGRAGGAGRIGRLGLPVRRVEEFSIGGVGFLDLGAHGVAVLAVLTPVPFAMRPPGQQQALVDCFARLLLSADAGIQIVVRARALDLSPAVAELAQAAASLPDPALRAAAAGHHDYLAALHDEGRLLIRQFVLVLREASVTGSSARAAAARERLLARLADAERALAPARITLTALPPAEAEEVLANAANPAANPDHTRPTTPTWPPPAQSPGRYAATRWAA